MQYMQLHFSCANFREAAFRRLTITVKESCSCATCKSSKVKSSNLKFNTDNITVDSNETLNSLITFVKFMSSQFDDFVQQLVRY